jgi:hypothetical protein
LCYLDYRSAPELALTLLNRMASRPRPKRS